MAWGGTVHGSWNGAWYGSLQINPNAMVAALIGAGIISSANLIESGNSQSGQMAFTKFIQRRGRR